MYLLAGVLNVNNRLMILMLQVMMIQKWKMTVVHEDYSYIVSNEKCIFIKI